MALATRMRAVSELRDSAPAIIREAADAPVGITRHGRMVAALISPEDLATFQELREAAERALVSLDAERALDDVSRGHVEGWDEVAARLRTGYRPER
jgi:PHD/YefM family antitoxin component YafN of YafNO toxin-antitoxin module